MLSSVPLNNEFTLSLYDTAKGIVSAMPIVSGLGPRDEPNDMDVLNDTLLRLGTLSVRSMFGAGLCWPVGRALACSMQFFLCQVKKYI